MVDQSKEPTYVFTKKAVLRSIEKLKENYIHEHFAGYLAILRARQVNQGLPIQSSDLVEFHDRYLRVVGAPERSPYVRPFKSRGNKGLETFNPNVAGSYAPSSLRSGGKLIEVIRVTGRGRDASYALHDGHALLARKHLLGGDRVPITALTAFLYRDYGFHLDEPDVTSIVRLFRSEFGLAADIDEEREIFQNLFTDDTAAYTADDLEELKAEVGRNG